MIPATIVALLCTVLPTQFSIPNHLTYPTLAMAIRETGNAYTRTRLTPSVAKLFGRVLEWRR